MIVFLDRMDVCKVEQTKLIVKRSFDDVNVKSVIQFSIPSLVYPLQK